MLSKQVDIDSSLSFILFIHTGQMTTPTEDDVDDEPDVIGTYGSTYVDSNESF